MLLLAAGSLACGRGRDALPELGPDAPLAEDRLAAASLLVPRQGASILLITIDTCRADRLGCYGNPRIRTPNLDALAARGVTWSDAVCQAPITLPSHCSIMTGQNPTGHGVRDNGRFVLGAPAVTLAEIFRDAGYGTAAFVGAFPVAAKFGLNQGFGLYSDELPKFQLLGRGVMLERPAAEVTDRAIGWLETHDASRPFFAWVHYFDPHWPYEPPGAYRQIYSSALYDGEIALVDAEVGRLLAALAARGLDRSTIVAVTADHGEGLGEHQEVSHSILLYDATMKIPLIIAPPAGAPGAPGRGAGLVADAQVRSVDVAPTLLELAAVPNAHAMDGITLRDAGGAPPPAGAAIAYMESYAPWYGFLWSPLRALRTTEGKFVEGPRSELYDLTRDPREMENLLPAAAAGAKPWKTAMEIVGEDRVASAESDLDVETVERLRALGYIGIGRTVGAARPKGGDNPGLPDPRSLIGLYSENLAPAFDLFRRGDFAASMQLSREALVRDSTNIQGLLLLGHAANRGGDFATAKGAYARVLELDPQNLGAHFSLASIAQRQGDVAAAEREYRATLAIEPALPEAQVDFALLLERAGRGDEARAAAERAIAADSTFSPAYRALGRLRRQSNDLAGAYDAYLRAFLIDPLDRGAESGILEAVTSDPTVGARALRDLEEAWREGQRAAPEAAALALVAQGMGRKELASGVLREAIAATPTAALLRLRSWTHRDAGRNDLAIADLEEAARLEPQNAEIHFSLGAFCSRNGFPDKAESAYEACVAIDPRHEGALVGLANILANRQQLGRAMILWERALQINPNSTAKENLEKARKMLGEGQGAR